MSEFYAHTAPGGEENWERLFTPGCAAELIEGGHMSAGLADIAP
jgi:hypothetical protein